jgi:hypothetical protein
MKLSSRLAKLKLSKTRPTESKAHPTEKVGKLTAGRWILGALCLLLVGSGIWVVLANFVWHKVPPELVGAWEVVDGPMKGGTFRFLPDGMLEIRSGQGEFIHARVVVDGSNLSTITTNPSTKREETRVSVIHELTDSSLVLQLEKGDVLRMVRRE